jgi:hypothetical protein
MSLNVGGRCYDWRQEQFDVALLEKSCNSNFKRHELKKRV